MDLTNVHVLVACPLFRCIIHHSEGDISKDHFSYVNFNIKSLQTQGWMFAALNSRLNNSFNSSIISMFVIQIPSDKHTQQGLVKECSGELVA